MILFSLFYLSLVSMAIKIPTTLLASLDQRFPAALALIWTLTARLTCLTGPMERRVLPRRFRSPQARLAQPTDRATISTSIPRCSLRRMCWPPRAPASQVAKVVRYLLPERSSILSSLRPGKDQTALLPSATISVERPLTISDAIRSTARQIFHGSLALPAAVSDQILVRTKLIDLIP